MSTQQQNPGMEKVKELIESIRIGMLTTQNEQGHLVSRPMAVMNIDAQGNLWFLTKKDSAKTDEIQQDYHVNVAFSHPDKASYVSVAGTATEIHDRAKIEELWSPMAKPWFPDGKEDPSLLALKVHTATAEYWDSTSSRMVRLFEMARAAITGDTYKEGENELVENR
ncbi:pyridoxamine 5'-phosphate oxidase family protein [Tellurirhabdus bombi]|uniref:pyridoxamine 5'-phosphate oxidase family protein n=1 Tax=Tellurirhabdus bombi TaxID=2907205 RepID=UPI001F453156|nr:pyridoxamine 5'-phosphate oxidase family protein [Tellurirhabdus bombi]